MVPIRRYWRISVVRDTPDTNTILIKHLAVGVVVRDIEWPKTRFRFADDTVALRESNFVGISVDEVKEIYQKLLEMSAVDEIHVLTVVSLNAHERTLASEAMSEQ